MIKKISSRFLHQPTGLTFTVDCGGRMSISNSKGDMEFIFKNSNKEVIRKIGLALCEISNFEEFILEL